MNSKLEDDDDDIEEADQLLLKNGQATNNIEEYLEIDTKTLVETSFYAHYFETGQAINKIFTPKYSLARVKNPLGSSSSTTTTEEEKDEEYWMSVHFNSKYDGDGIRKCGRPKLHLVVALDISGKIRIG